MATFPERIADNGERLASELARRAYIERAIGRATRGRDGEGHRASSASPPPSCLRAASAKRRSDLAQPGRKPLPRTDHRIQKIGIGPGLTAV